MAKPVVEILDEEELRGMPSQVVVAIPITEDLTNRLIEPCVRYLAENAETVIDLDDTGRLRAGVEFDVGLSRIMFDVEETLADSLEMEALPLALVAIERMRNTLRELLPSDPEEREALRPKNYDKLSPKEQTAIDRALDLKKD